MDPYSLNTIKIGNNSMDYLVFGEGPIPLLLIPGLGLKRLRDEASSLVHRNQVFAKDFKVIVPDRREIIQEGFSIKDMGEDIIELLNILSIENPCVMGISQGGMVAQYLAIQYPGLFKKIVFGVTASRPNPLLNEGTLYWMDLAEKQDLEGLVKTMMESVYSSKYKAHIPGIVRMVCKNKSSIDLHRFKILAKAGYGFDFYDRLNEINCPCLVLGASKDKIVTGEASIEMAEKLNCPIYMFENYGHGVYEEEPRLNLLAKEFFLEG